MFIKIVRHMKRQPRGVTLVELAAVLAILGILITIAVPRYVGVRKQAYKDEAAHILEEVKNLEWGYYLQNNAFTDSLGSTGFVMPGDSHWGTPALSVSGNQGQGGGDGNGNGNGSCNNGNGQGNGNNNGNGNGNGQGNGNSDGNGNCNGSGAQPSVVITVSGQVIPLAGVDQVSVILYGDGSASAGSTF